MTGPRPRGRAQDHGGARRTTGARGERSAAAPALRRTSFTKRTDSGHLDVSLQRPLGS